LIPEHIWAADVSSVFTWVIASCELIVVIRICSYNKSKYNGGTIKQHGTISQVDSEKS
jgi:hypothetical protein